MGAIWLRDLPQVIAAAGIPVKTWPGWESRSNAKGGYDGIFGVCVHHTGSKQSAIDDMTYMWNNALLKPVGAIYLARDGSVTVGAAGQTNCQGLGGPRSTSKGTIPLDQGNRYALAIEAGNAGTGEVWPSPQQDMYVRLVAALIEGYDLQVPDSFAHHEWTTRKIDPAGNSRYASGGASWNMNKFRVDVTRALTPTPTPIPGDDMPTLNPPVRIYDSRKTGGALSANEVRTIPIFANAVGVNITVVAPASDGWLTAWGPNPRPDVSNVQFRTGQNTDNFAQVFLEPGTGILRVSPTAACHVIVDLLAAS